MHIRDEEDERLMSEKEEYRLIITVKEIRGNCPVFKVGEKIVIQSPKMVINETDNLCIHAFGCMLSMIVPLSHGTSFKQFKLNKNECGKRLCPMFGPLESLMLTAKQCFSRLSGKNVTASFTKLLL
jgi:uncharacterized repeat protein (TIGR04076 family)